MTALDYILEGLRRDLEVERELGTRTVEVDRALLKTAVDGHAGRVILPLKDESGDNGAAALPSKGESGSDGVAALPQKNEPPVAAPAKIYDYVFLHHAALNPKGIEMMAKLIHAMKTTPERAPVVFTGALPKARYYVVLGQRALAQWFPSVRGAMDRWTQGGAGEEILYTHSPDDFTRFGVITRTSPLYRQKAEMWNALKGLMRRLGISQE